ncbi:MAG TPA: MG2 domain-containing protein, partial [Pyrinomonadaceae bacterium]
MTRRTVLSSIACYLGLVLLVAGFAVLRVRTQNRFAAQTAPDSLPMYGREITVPDPHAKPFFSIQTSRTYSTSDRARVSINYRGVRSLDFRVYKVKDPVKFFRELEDPHRIGEDEEAKAAELTKRKPTFLENLRQFKSYVYATIKRYVRSQLQNQSRKGFNQRFRVVAEEEETPSVRTPLNVGELARVPLLNPDQMIDSWREELPPLEDAYDRRTISLGRREPGVYLVEVVNGDLRAFGLAIVTDIAMVEKSANDGQTLFYVVERKSGAPRAGVNVQIIRGKDDITKGTTDQQGILRMQLVRKPQPTEEEEEDEEAPEEEAAAVDTPYLVTATDGNDFAISDLNSFYFQGDGGEGEDGGGAELTSYLYTDRPVYRPEQKVYFKGILRQLTDQGYKLLPDSTVSVSVEDQSGGRIYEQELKLSTRGTFSGELDLPEESPLGYYTINAQAGDASASGGFEVQEYKKPEFKVKVTTPRAHVNVGEKTSFTVSARYFFGAPVARASVKYYVYRSRHYGWWDAGGEAEEDEFGADPSRDEDESSGYSGYDDNMVLEGEGKLDA